MIKTTAFGTNCNRIKKTDEFVKKQLRKSKSLFDYWIEEYIYGLTEQKKMKEILKIVVPI